MRKKYFIPDVTPLHMEVPKETIGNWALCTGEVVLTELSCVPLGQLFSCALGFLFVFSCYVCNLPVPSGWVFRLATSSLKWRSMNLKILLVCFAFCITPEVLRCKNRSQNKTVMLDAFNCLSTHAVLRLKKILCYVDRL